MNLSNLGLEIPEILLPKKDINMTKWAVVACDQYTSEPEYWKHVETFVGDAPSTLKLIYPEVYLESEDNNKRIENINKTMSEYIQKNIFTSTKSFILVDRKTTHTKSRKGLVVALDLDKYDFNKGSETLVRATEGTILERLPPRIKIREHAEIELPHIMVLIDDPKKTVIEPLFHEKLEKAYDFELMENSGHIKGFFVKDEKQIDQISENLSFLADKRLFNKKYNLQNKEVLLYAVGDGNHSLATAKSIWEELKKKGVKEHPARYALVELVNVHDEGLEFKPIHRIVFNVSPAELIEKMQAFFEKENSSFEWSFFKNEKEMNKELEKKNKNKTEKSHIIGFVSEGKYGILEVKSPKRNLEVGTLQAFLDEAIPKKDIDYVHGEDVVNTLGSKKAHMGFFLPPMSKHELFKTVILEGALPRKTFSMGEASEKRFYLEARKIK